MGLQSIRNGLRISSINFRPDVEFGYQSLASRFAVRPATLTAWRVDDDMGTSSCTSGRFVSVDEAQRTTVLKAKIGILHTDRS